MERLGPGLLVLALAAGLIALVLVGWRGRLRRQSGVPAPPAAPAALGEERMRCEGQYVVTTTAGDWLDRVAVHGLGIRTEATASVHGTGVLFERAGAGDLFLPREDIEGVRLESGMAGKFVEEGGLVVISWSLGGTDVDTGFRARFAAEKNALVAAIEDLIKTAPGTGAGQERVSSD
ncbi:hypothetical protein [Sinomonas halotolerans]|uniref:PH domain-containing protein n=1 Tax=Sinomonas halotolerans TaxID=1644133 RepID=A0ABU9WZG7_9MICC